MNEFISPSASLGSQTMSDQGQASLPSDNAPFYSVPSPPMIAWDAFRDARRAALEQEVAALASVAPNGAYLSRVTGCGPSTVNPNGFDATARALLYERSLQWANVTGSS